MSDFVQLAVLPQNRVLPARKSETLLAALRAAGIFIEASCGGEGRCGRCAVEPVRGDFEAGGGERGGGLLLACRASPLSDAAVRIPSAARNASWAVQKAGAPAGALSLAVDLGTTTLSAGLGGPEAEPFAECRRLNPQVAWGSDVLRRLGAASDPKTAKALKELVRAAARELVSDLFVVAGVDPRRVSSCALACNSAMALLFLGLDPAPLSVAPFDSGLDELATVALDPLLFGLPAGASCFLMPGIGSFVGSDTTAGLLACSLRDGARPALFIDAGTNGEIVLAPEKGPLLAASAAAGPAFEGGHLACGGPAAAGAVNSAAIGTDGAVTFTVIGGGAPAWLCGSGVLQLTAGLLSRGFLDRQGRLKAGGPVRRGADGTLAAEIGDGPRGPVRFTQHDLREVQLAAGAIKSAWRTLSLRAGLDPRKLRRVVLTGSFGGALDAEAARGIGLIPETDADVELLSSGALRGALKAAAGAAPRAEVERLAREVRHVPLADEGFQELFLEALELGPFPG